MAFNRNQRDLLVNLKTKSGSSTPRLTWAPPDLPIDVISIILGHYARISPRCAQTALLISPLITPSIEDAVYSTVSIFSLSGLSSFNHLLKNRPDIGRRVNSLWIAPCRLTSDLIPALAPPNASATSEALQNKVQSLARNILRSCRRLKHIALDGGFITPQAATGFGTACKPQSLLCVNPHSFLGHFSAPIFRTSVRRLEVVDQTLACEEVDEIRLMQGLRYFYWTSPRANSDVTRDVSVLLRILAPRAQDREADPQLLEALLSSGTAPPEKSRKNEELKSICASTSQARAAALAASFKKVVESVELNDEEGERLSEEEQVYNISSFPPIYVDSGSANSNMLHRPTGVELQTRALSSLMEALDILNADNRKRIQGRINAQDGKGEEDEANGEDEIDDDDVVEEWEALRDVVCQRRTGHSTHRLYAGLGSAPPSGFTTPGWANSRPPSPPATPRDDVDGGRALQRIWRRWKHQIDTGELDHACV